jgi:hypothetical protein
MRNPVQKRLLATAAAVAVLGAIGVKSNAAVLYSTIPGNTPSGTAFTFTANDAAAVSSTPADVSNNTNQQGIATYYNTGYATLTLTDLQFYGGLPQTTAAQTNGANGDSLELQFYNSSGGKIGFPNGTITNSTSAQGADALYTVSTLQPSFLGGGPITVPGAGYVALIPTNNAPGEPTGTPTPYPANQPTEDLYFTSSAPSVGTGNGALFGTTGYNPATGGGALLTTSSTPPSGVSSPDYLEIRLDGTGTGSVPEPASIALLAGPLAMLLKRSRRTV